jgi:hypothetical protein
VIRTIVKDAMWMTGSRFTLVAFTLAGYARWGA